MSAFDTERVRVLGVRHHGPGSARSLRTVLRTWRPTTVLVELPADTQRLLPWVATEGLVPPVAVLGHVLDRPRHAAFVPFAEFSPEWQACAWARANGAELEAFDLPLAVSLAMSAAPDGEELLDLDPMLRDPLAALAAAAGDTDAERWWDDVVEHRGDGEPAFDAVAEAMCAVRGGWEAVTRSEACREAHMRSRVRAALAGGAERVAVVCGAWHVPALLDGPTAAADARTLRGMPKVKVGLSWVPWTHQRLAAGTGYGAGVQSPGWYRHVFRHPGSGGVERWFVDAARELRREGMQISPDDVISATRAADALAALRGRPRPGLAEVLDAAEAVMAATTALDLVRHRMVVGAVIGSVPPDAPQVPLARDLALQQRRVRLAPAAERRQLELDVRTPNGRTRSVLLHRLLALDVPWGVPDEGRGSSGNFRETWNLCWEPELAVRVIERAAFGTTLESAASSYLVERASTLRSLADLVDVLATAIAADLPDVVQSVVGRIGAIAANDSDVSHLIDAAAPLARTLRYGDVRGSDAASVEVVFDEVVRRVLAGLVPACRSLDEGAAHAMAERLTVMNAALAVTEHPVRGAGWPAVLAIVADRHDVHGAIQGRATRLLHDAGAWRRSQLAARVGRALSAGVAPSAGAAFVEGFVAGSGTVLVHDRELLAAIDGWLSGLSSDSFVATVPLLRRTFSTFEPAERRQLGRLLSGEEIEVRTRFGPGLDADRANAGLATVRQMLGVPT